MKGLKLNWAEYKDPQKGKSTETHTYLLHNLPEGTFKPLEELPKVKISREKSRTINSIMADCLMTIFSDVIDDKQRFLVSDILDLMDEPPQTELAVSTYVKEMLNIDEGYAFPTLQETTNPKRGTGIVTDPEIISAAGICARLGTGEQVILQGNQILYRGYVYTNKYFTWAVCKLRRHYLPNLSFMQAMVLVGTLGDTMNLRDVDQDNKAWVIMWRTHERPLGVRVVPVSAGIFF